MQNVQVNNLIRASTFFQNAGIAIVFVFMPIIARDVTSSVFEIGIVVASFSFAQILSEIYFGRYSDKLGKRLFFIRAGFVGCAVAFGMHVFADDLTTLFLARIAAGIASGIMIPALIAYAYEANVQAKRAATIVSFHALGWLVGIAAGGFVTELDMIFLISSAAFIVGLVFTIRLPSPQQKIEESGATRRIIKNNKFLFLSLLLRHIGASSVWTILPIMIVEELGGQTFHISVVYVANTLTAFVLMNLMASRIKIPDVTKFKIGIGCTAFVFVGLSLATEWWMTMPFMSLVGATWAFLFIGGNFHLMANNPHSTSTGIFSSTISIATVIGPVMSGVIAFAYGYTWVMYFAVAIIVCAFIISLKIKS